MPGSVHPEDRFPPASAENARAGTDRLASGGSAGAVGGPLAGSRVLGETELDSALQLLVERAQYITGATGTALALPQGDEMVCRASAGSSAPAVGARLQVRSGLTGESMARRQLLRCDNAESDPRVNLEACRALGIASIVVLPLLRRSGEVRGLFELFSDHPYAFEERDLIALERMADLTLTALDLAEQRQSSVPTLRRELGKPVEPLQEISAASSPPAAAILVKPEFPESPVGLAEPPAVTPPLAVATTAVVTTPVSAATTPAPAPVPEAMLRVQKCASCGFPVSEGRTLCLDCERKDSEKKNFEKKQREQAQSQVEQQLEEHQVEPQTAEQGQQEQDASPDAAFAVLAQEEFVPAFLANSQLTHESWLANHVNLLAVFVLILGILVVIVVLR